jgi:hypothetical protein
VVNSLISSLVSHILTILKPIVFRIPKPSVISYYKWKSHSCNRPWRNIGLWNVEASTIFRCLRSCQLYSPAALYPQKNSWYKSVRGWVDTTATLRLEGLCHLKNPLNLIKPGTFRLVAQCLDQLRYCIHHIAWRSYMSVVYNEEQNVVSSEMQTASDTGEAECLCESRCHIRADEWWCTDYGTLPWKRNKQGSSESTLCDSPRIFIKMSCVTASSFRLWLHVFMASLRGDLNKLWGAVPPAWVIPGLPNLSSDGCTRGNLLYDSLLS